MLGKGYGALSAQFLGIYSALTKYFMRMLGIKKITILYFSGFFTNAEHAQNNFMLIVENTPIDINARRIFDQKQNDFNSKVFSV